MINLIRKNIHHSGMVLVYAGAILLIISYIVGWINVNAVQLVALTLIVIGVILHVYFIKKGMG